MIVIHQDSIRQDCLEKDALQFFSSFSVVKVAFVFKLTLEVDVTSNLLPDYFILFNLNSAF